MESARDNKVRRKMLKDLKLLRLREPNMSKKEYKERI
jgi:hypothetical protein